MAKTSEHQIRRRAFYRVSLSRKIPVTLKHSGGLSTGQMTNLSVYGATFELPSSTAAQIQAGDTLAHFQFEIEGKSIDTQAKVVRIEPSSEDHQSTVGVEFSELPGDAVWALSAWVASQMKTAPKKKAKKSAKPKKKATAQKAQVKKVSAKKTQGKKSIAKKSAPKKSSKKKTVAKKVTQKKKVAARKKSAVSKRYSKSKKPRKR